MFAHIEPPVSTTPPVEVGVIGVNLPADKPATDIRRYTPNGTPIITYDLRRLTENLAILWAKRLFGDSIRVVTMAGA